MAAPSLSHEDVSVDNWKKAHAVLLQEEKKLSDMALAVSGGTISESEMDSQRERVHHMRELTDAVLDKLLLGNRGVCPVSERFQGKINESTVAEFAMSSPEQLKKAWGRAIDAEHAA